MIEKFSKVTDNIYRGSAPSIKDVLLLKKYGINKIISLDNTCGKKIEKICKNIGIKQEIHHLDGKKANLLKFLSKNLKKMLEEGGPTFIHCRHGKDRTGFVCALYRIKYQNKSLEEAMEEANSFGFGIGCAPEFINMYKKVLKEAAKKNNNAEKDNNDADIVSNVREYRSDNLDSYYGSSIGTSFGPYAGTTKQYPYDIVYNNLLDQSPTRDNLNDKPIKFDADMSIPIIGLYDNAAGVKGTGPYEPIGGFIHD